MSEIMAQKISDKIIDILRDVDELDALSFVRGVLWPAPRQHLWPFAEVVVTSDDDGGAATGATYTRTYSGYIQINVHVKDFEEARARVMRVPSYDEILMMVDAALTELRKTTDRYQVYRSLEDLTADDEAVQQFDVIGPREYGIERRDERRDNFYNYGLLPFQVETVEVIG